MIFLKSKNFFFIILLTSFLLLSIFSNTSGELVIYKDYVVSVSEAVIHRDPGIYRDREILKFYQFAKFIKYSVIFLIGIFNLLIIYSFKDRISFFLKKKYWLINFFFLVLILNYLLSFAIHKDIHFFRKILICLSLFSFFLFFSSINLNKKFIENLIKAFKFSIICTFILIVFINFISHSQSSFFQFIYWPRLTGLVGFFGVSGNAFAFIICCLFLFILNFEKNFYIKIFFLIISLAIVFSIQSRLSISILLSLYIISYFKNEKFLKFFLYVFFISFVFYTFFLTYLINYFLEINNYENFILKPYGYLNNIFEKCPFVGLDYKKIFSEMCDNIMFKILDPGMQAQLYNFLVSVLWRLSYNFEVINMIIVNNFRPFFLEVTDLSKYFVTDIGVLRHNLNLFVNAHNSFLLIFLKTSILGIFCFILFLFLICKKLISREENILFLFLIFIIFFHSMDDFLIGNHIVASQITWVTLGIIFNKAYNV